MHCKMAEFWGLEPLDWYLKFFKLWECGGLFISPSVCYLTILRKMTLMHPQ